MMSFLTFFMSFTRFGGIFLKIKVIIFDGFSYINQENISLIQCYTDYGTNVAFIVVCQTILTQ